MNLLIVLLSALLSTPLSPWRGVEGEAVSATTRARGEASSISMMRGAEDYAFSAPDSLMHEVSVTAFRRLSETGIQRTSLDTMVLHQSVAHAMSDILTAHSSLYVKSYGRATESTVEFRGTSPTHTQVLWNGMKINSPMLGTVDFSTIPAYFVDQANLLHGASSLTLTGGGLGGAIELINQPQQNKGLGLQYIQGIGSFDTYDQFLRLTYANDHWSSSTRVVYATSDNDFRYTNYDKKVDERDADGVIVRSYHPTERNRSGYFHDLHVLQEAYYHDAHLGRLSAVVWFTHSLRGLPFLSVDYRDDTDFTNEQLQNAVRSAFSLQRPFGDAVVLDAHAGYSYQDIAYDYSTKRASVTTDITHSQSYSQQAFAQTKVDYMPASSWLLTANLEVAYNHVRSHDKSPFHIGDNYNRGRMESSLTLSAKYRATKRLALSSVLREELYRNDFVPLFPVFFAEYTLWNKRPKSSLIFKTSIARNYRYPSMDDLYFRPGGNPDLRPERGFTYDGGLEGNLHFPLSDQTVLSLKTNLSAFDSHITDWILWTPNAKGFWQPFNLKRVHSYGTEFMLDARLQLPRDWTLMLTGNYAFTPSINQSRDLDDNDTSYGKQLVYVPRHSANANVRVQWRTWTFTYQWNSYSERFTTTSNEVTRITGRLKPYYMNDISLEKQFYWRHIQASLKGVVNNLFGSEYVTVLSRPMAGRNFEIFLELKPQWKPRKSSRKQE